MTDQIVIGQLLEGRDEFGHDSSLLLCSISQLNVLHEAVDAASVDLLQSSCLLFEYYFIQNVYYFLDLHILFF